MRKIKIILLSIVGFFVLLIALIGIAVLILDNEDYKKLVTLAVEESTGYKVAINGTFELDLSTEPFLKASQIRFEPGRDFSEPPISSIGHLEMKLAAKQLLTGRIIIRYLFIDDVTISLTVGEEENEKPKGEKISGDINIPLLENVILRNIIVDLSDVDKGHLFQTYLHEFKIQDDPESGLRYAKGAGLIDIYDFKIEGRIGSLRHMLDDSKPYPISVNFMSHDIEFRVSGVIDDIIAGEGINLHVAGGVEELSNFLKLFKVDFPGLGRLKLEADISGNSIASRASNVDISISEGSQIELEAKGSISDVVNGKGVDIAIIASSTNNDFIRMLLPDILSDFTRFDIKGNLRDRGEDYALEDIVAFGSNDKDLVMDAEGLLNFGRFENDPPLQEIDLNLRATSPTTEDAKRFLVDMLPELGPLTAAACLKGPIERLSLEDISVGTRESGPLRVKAQGRIGWIPIDDTPVSGIDLALSAKAEKTEVLASAFDIKMPELGDISIKSRLLYSDDQLQFNDIDVQSSHTRGLNVGLSGTVEMSFDESKEDPGNVDVRVVIDAPNMGAAEPLLGARVFSALGPVKGKAKITGDTKVISFEDLTVTVGQPENVIVTWQGRIGQSQLFGDHLIADVEIVGTITAEEAADFASYADISIPDLGPLKGTWRLVDCKGSYCVDDWEWIVGHADKFQLRTTGKIDSVLRKGSVSMDGIDFDVTAAAPVFSAVPFLADLGLPDLGALQMKAKMTSKGGRVDIGKCMLLAGPDEAPTLSVEGEILNVESPEKTAINSNFEAMIQPWVEKLMGRTVTKDQKVFGTLKLSGLADRYRIKQLNLETKDPDHLSLQTNGVVKKIKQVYETEIQVTANSKDPSAAGSMFGIALPPFSPISINGELKSKGGKAEFKGAAEFGKTHFETFVSHSTAGNDRPTIIAKNRSANVYLSDLGIYPEELEEEPDPEKNSKSKRKRIFTEDPLSFDGLKALNLSLSIDADNLIGKNYTINNLDFDLTLSEGMLRISPAKMSYAEGNISFEFTVDATGDHPEIILKATAEDIDLEALLAHMHRPLILGGNLNLAVDLRSKGSSPHEIVSSLNGDLGFAIENGKIKRDVEMITADAIDFLTALPKIKNYQDLNCMTSRFIFDQGVGRSEILFLDTPNVRTQGGAVIDLVSERLDMVFQPKPKKGLPGLNSAVRIQGPLSNPSVRKMPFKEAARLYGEIFMPYVFLPARGLGYLWYLMKNDKDEESPCLNLATQNE